MRKVAITVLIFFLLFDGMAGFLIATGGAQTLGIDAGTGGGDQLDDSVQTAEEYSPENRGVIESLFGPIMDFVGGVGASILGAINPGLTLLDNVTGDNFTPINTWFLQPLASIVKAIAVYDFIRGT